MHFRFKRIWTVCLDKRLVPVDLFRFVLVRFGFFCYFIFCSVLLFSVLVLVLALVLVLIVLALVICSCSVYALRL